MHDDKTAGLTTLEARRLASEGFLNATPKKRADSVITIIRRHTLTLFNLLNIGLAAALMMVRGYRNMLFMGVVISNAFIGLFQELRAMRAHDKLELLSRGKVRALRDGEETELDPEELVLGDVVLLRRGDSIPADARVISGECSANEAMLTGESVPVKKAAGDKLLSGGYLTEGSVRAKLTAVGENSYAGAMQASARLVTRPKSELMLSMRRLIRIVSICIVPLGALLFSKTYYVLKLPLQASVTGTVAAVLGMIPEGLMLLTSMSLAAGVVKLARYGTLVNELYSIETLARTDIICFDKTGTLTAGEMSVKGILPLSDMAESGIERRMRALSRAFEKEGGATQDALCRRFAPGDDAPGEAVPFSSDRKWSAAFVPGLGALYLGAPEMLRGGCAPGSVDIVKSAAGYAEEGVRALALLTGEGALSRENPQNLTPLALILLSDAVRDTARGAIDYFASQGVSLKVISGDSAGTVRSVAMASGVPGAENAVDMSGLPEGADMDEIAEKYSVFGRVLPNQKRELIEALKRKGHTVAMIGDGVNDIPALKAADCSIAVAGGSDAACRIAQLTLMTKDFSVAPQIVAEGRRVINNISRAAALYLVKNTFSLLLSVMLMALPFAYPFSPIQLTLISAITIGIPSFVLALQPSREKVVGSFLKTVFFRALPGGITVALLALSVLFISRPMNMTRAEISTMCTLITGISGLCVLARVCYPINLIRGVLLCAMAALFTLCAALFPRVFYLVPLTGTKHVCLLLLTALAPLLQHTIRRGLDGLSLKARRHLNKPSFSGMLHQ